MEVLQSLQKVLVPCGSTQAPPIQIRPYPAFERGGLSDEERLAKAGLRSYAAILAAGAIGNVSMVFIGSDKPQLRRQRLINCTLGVRGPKSFVQLWCLLTGTTL